MIGSQPHGRILMISASSQLRSLLLQGEQVTAQMLNIVIAACCQVGDLARAFETFEVNAGAVCCIRVYRSWLCGMESCLRQSVHLSLSYCRTALQQAVNQNVVPCCRPRARWG